MSITVKGTLILSVIGLTYLALSFGIIGQFIMPSYEEIEHQQAARESQNLALAFDQEIAQLASFAEDWASWDDTHSFLLKPKKSYLHGDLVYSSFADKKLSLFGLFNLEGKPVWGLGFDFEWEQEISVSKVLEEELQGNPNFLAHRSGDPVSGILLTRQWTLLIASFPVTTTARDVAPVGTLVLAKIIDKEALQAIEDKIRYPIFLWRVGDPELPANVAGHLAALTLSTPTSVEPVDDSRLSVYRLLPDIHGAPAVLVRADILRDAHALGGQRVNQALGALLLLGIVLIFVLLILMQGFVFGPISRLARRIAVIDIMEDFDHRLNIRRRDDIGVIAESFDALLDRLKNPAETAPPSRAPAVAAVSPMTVETPLEPLEILSIDGVVREAVAQQLQNSPSSIAIDSNPRIGELPAVTAPRQQLVQAIGVLISHGEAAISDARDAGGRISIDGERQLRAGGEMVHLRIADNGIGIERDDLQLIFRQDQNLEGGSDRSTGLAWCDSLVSSLGGRLYAESNGRNQGATFHLLLPISES